jgi:hypothetical protein
MMKLSEFRDGGGRVVFVDVVVFEMAVVFICLGRTAAEHGNCSCEVHFCCMNVTDAVESCY